jgi:hypothetical protein
MESLPRWLVSLALFTLALLSLAEPARAVGIALAPPTSGPGSQITFTVALDAPASINGYDVTISWDALELSFLSAAELSGLGFVSAPLGTTPAGERVASFELTAVTTTSLFSASFDVLPGALGDGADDFAVFVGPANGSGLIPGAIDNPDGAGFDVVPEPNTGGLLALGLLALARLRGARRRRR